MNSVVRQTLSLVLLLTQAVTTVTGSAFTLCISPMGRECIDTPWSICTCCRDDGTFDPANQPPSSAGDEKLCRAEQRCSCHLGHDEVAVATPTSAPSSPDSASWNGHPCRCKHIPLITAGEGQQASAERISVADRHVLDQFVSDPVTSPLAGFSPSRHAVTLLPLPSPSGHLLAISCTVLRC
jgi:hypothetical protein